MGELGHLIGLLTQCTQSIVATWLIFTNWCWKLRLTWDSFMPMYLNFLLNPWSKASPTLITNPYTCWTMWSLIVAILTNILSFLYQALDASSPYDRDTQFKALHVTSCLNHHSILSLLNNRIRYSVDQDMMKRPSDANGGSLLHSPVRRQKPREIEVLVNPTRRK